MVTHNCCATSYSIHCCETGKILHGLNLLLDLGLRSIKLFSNKANFKPGMFCPGNLAVEDMHGLSAADGRWWHTDRKAYAQVKDAGQ